MDITCNAEKWEEDLKDHYVSSEKKDFPAGISGSDNTGRTTSVIFLLHFAENDYLMMSLSTLYFTKTGWVQKSAPFGLKSSRPERILKPMSA